MLQIHGLVYRLTKIGEGKLETKMTAYMPNRRPPKCAAWSIGERRERIVVPNISKAATAQQADPAVKLCGTTLTSRGTQSNA